MKAVGAGALLVVFLLVVCSCTGGTPEKVASPSPPSGAEVGAGTYKSGDTVSFSSHSLTVNSVKRDDLLVVNVTFRNISPRDFTLHPARLFDAFDSEGNRLQFHAKDEPDALAGTLAKGGTLTGNVYFDISPHQKGITLQYHVSQLGLMLAGSVEFTLD